ncbi:MAG: thiol:disulfide interchange protein TlpA [Beijerinckiaceae bacterium]
MKRTAIAAFATLALAGLGLYGVFYAPGNAQAQSCAAAKPVLATLRPLAIGEVAAVQVPDVSKQLPDLAFTAPDGKPTTLASLRGKTVLLNLWATWCAPCRKEMPALDRLQTELGGTDFEVVAVNIDQRNLDKPKAFLQEIGVSKLAYYTDPSAKIFQSLKAVDRAFGMPTTLLIDKNGCELGYLAGPAEWSSDDAVKLVQGALGR